MSHILLTVHSIEGSAALDTDHANHNLQHGMQPPRFSTDRVLLLNIATMSLLFC